jgi:NDP-sugar pyrophosphorylase family protein
VAGKPILQHIVEHARDEGFTNFIFSIHYLGHMIEEYFGDGKKFNVNIEYLREDKPLGTAGALSLIKTDSKLPLLITNGDVITDISYRQLLEFHKINDATMTMAVRAHEWQNPFGVVTLQGIEVTGYLEKPISRSVTNAGVYVVDRESLSLLVNHEYCDMPDFLELVANSQSKIIAYPLHEEWIDVGRPEDFTLAHDWVTRKESKGESNNSNLASKETPND